MKKLLLILSVLLFAGPAFATGIANTGGFPHTFAGDCTAVTGPTLNDICFDTTAGANTGIWLYKAAGWARVDDTIGAGGGATNVVGNCTGASCFVDGVSDGTTLWYEGSTIDGFETILTFSGDPGADFIVSIPNETGTLLTSNTSLVGDVTGIAGATVVGNDSHDHSAAGSTVTIDTADIADVSVTQVELEQLETIGATTVSANQWGAVGSMAETLTGAEIDRLDGLTGIIVTDATAVTDLEGTGLSITAGVLNASGGAGGTVDDISGSSGTTTGANITIAAGAGIATTAVSGDTLTIVADTADLTTSGVIEIADVTETNTGTDATRSVSPDGLDGWTGSAQIVTAGALQATSLTTAASDTAGFTFTTSTNSAETRIDAGTSAAGPDGELVLQADLAGDLTNYLIASGIDDELQFPQTLSCENVVTDADGGVGCDTSPTIAGTNFTGTAASLTAGTVTTNANLTGEVTSVGNASTIASGVVDADNLAAILTFADDDLIDMSAINNSDGAEGLILPQLASACAAAITEGQICWDTAGADLYIGNGSAPVQMNTGSGITDVYDCSTGDCNGITVETGETFEVDPGGHIESDQAILQFNNDSGADLPACTAVYISAFDIPSDLPEVEIADADNAANMPAIGLVEATTTNGSNGKAVLTGTIDNVDTSTAEAWSVGDALYVNDSGTSVAGDCENTLTNVRPVNTDDAIQSVARVSRVHNTAGQLTVSGAGRTNDVPNLTNSTFWVGNGFNVATSVNMSGDATMINTGEVSIANDAIVDDNMGSDDFGDFTCAGTAESCTLDTGVVDTAELAADAVTMTEIDSTIDFLVSGTVRGNVNNIVTTGTTDSPTADEMRGSFLIYTNAAAVTVTLPAIGATGDGLSGCFYNLDGTAGATLTLDPNIADGIRLNGTLDTDGDSITSEANAGDFICVIARDNGAVDEWITLGRSGTWTAN